MEMPKPGEAHKKLAALVGEWIGDETLHPSPWDPAGGVAQARVSNRWVADGFAVVQEYEQRRNGKVTFQGHGVFWFDPARQEYVMHWWDSMGGAAGEYRGRFDGQQLSLRSPMPQGGHSRTSWTLTGPNAHDFLMEVSPDGEAWQPAMQGAYTRRSAAATGRPKKARKAAPRKAAKASRARKGAAARSTAASRGSRKTRRAPARKSARARKR